MAARVVVVTGGGRGIGRAICERFARDGDLIVPISRTDADLAETKKVCEAAGGQCAPVNCDVSSHEAVDAAIGKILSAHHRIDVVVNNAGWTPLASLCELSPDDYRRLLAINVDAVFYMTQAVWPIMMRQGGGAIVNISSQSSVDPYPGLNVYGACKAWVNIFTKAMADEGRGRNIRVFSVAPGAVETGLLRSLFPDIPEDQTLAPESVAEVVFQSAAEGQSAASGTTLFLRK
jgi:3-oxoacyl-[acyl-carrier protein] reductase